MPGNGEFESHPLQIVHQLVRAGKRWDKSFTMKDLLPTFPFCNFSQQVRRDVRSL
jgi:hypothetical protein